MYITFVRDVAPTKVVLFPFYNEWYGKASCLPCTSLYCMYAVYAIIGRAKTSRLNGARERLSVKELEKL